MVWMMAFWTIRSSLSFTRPDDTLAAEFLREPSPSSKSTLILRCLSSVLKTSSTVGPTHTHTHMCWSAASLTITMAPLMLTASSCVCSLVQHRANLQHKLTVSEEETPGPKRICFRGGIRQWRPLLARPGVSV